MDMAFWFQEAKKGSEWNGPAGAVLPSSEDGNVTMRSRNRGIPDAFEGK